MTEKDKKQHENRYAERVAQAKVVRRIVFICIIIFIIILGAAGASAYYYVKSALGPIDIDDQRVIDVHIPIGSSSTQIGQILEGEGLIKSKSFFRYYVRYKNETGFQAGDYELTKSMPLTEIIANLKEGKVIQEPELVFTVPEGLWLEDVVSVIAKNTIHEEEEIMEVLTDNDYLEKLVEKYSVLSEEIFEDGIKFALEGYLFPARYDFLEKEPSIETIIEAMLDRTEKVFSKYEPDLVDTPYTIHEIITLASIIEREAKTSEDRYKISGVLYNRLNRNMMLQVDPTVAYALGEHRYMTTFNDLEVDSPYNTYRYAGIPIGPIANPGEDAIRAAILPDDIEYLFFYARFNGEVIYTKTYQEHSRVHQQYRHEWQEARP